MLHPEILLTLAWSPLSDLISDDRRITLSPGLKSLSLLAAEALGQVS